MPTPVSPNTGAPERTFAKNQPEYIPLDVACYEAQKPSTYLMRYQLSDEERAAIAAGADIYVSMVGCVAPHRVEIGHQPWMTPRMIDDTPPKGERTILVIRDRVLQLAEDENIILWAISRENDQRLEVQFTGAVGVPERYVAAIIEAGEFQAQAANVVFKFKGCGLIDDVLRRGHSIPDAMQISYDALSRSDL